MYTATNEPITNPSGKFAQVLSAQMSTILTTAVALFFLSRPPLLTTSRRKRCDVERRTKPISGRWCDDDDDDDTVRDVGVGVLGASDRAVLRAV